MKLKRFGWTLKDEKFRKTYKKNEINKLILKSLLSSLNYKSHYKFYFSNVFRKYSKRTSVGIYKRYCLFTYSGKVVFKNFKLSRHVFKSMASLGHLSGLRKSSF